MFWVHRVFQVDRYSSKERPPRIMQSLWRERGVVRSQNRRWMGSIWVDDVMTSIPNRVAGGVIIRTNKRKAKLITKTLTIDSDGRASSTSLLSSLNRKNNVHVNSSISTIPRNDDKFDSNDDDDNEIPSDLLLCLRTYTGNGIVSFNDGDSGTGILSETCAYCPIFGVDSNHDEALPVLCAAAPFLTRGVLLNALVGHDSHDKSSHSNREKNLVTSRKRIQAEREIHNLLISDLVRPLHLQGISAAFGDDEDDDVALMEMNIYVDASRMALEHHFSASSSIEISLKDLHDWFVSVLLPQYKGRTWFPSSFVNFDKTAQCMILQLTHASLLLPKRDVGCDSHNGYWFSLPGLGKAAHSIEEGRANIMQRLRSCPHNEKKRTALEHDIERSIVERRAWRRESEGSGRKNKKSGYSQSGKFVVMDMLAKGRVRIHVTCTGEQFVRMAEER
jgi:hypothetical protein